MSSFERIKERLNTVLGHAEEIAKLLPHAIHYPDPWEVIRRHRRDLDHAVRQTLKAFSVDQFLLADLEHQLVGCLKQDVEEAAGYVASEREKVGRLREAMDVVAPGGCCGPADLPAVAAAGTRHFEASCAAFAGCETWRQRVVESCRLTRVGVEKICADADARSAAEGNDNLPRPSPKTEAGGVGQDEEVTDGREAPPTTGDAIAPPAAPESAGPDSPTEEHDRRFCFDLVGAIWKLRFEDECGDFSDNDYTGLRYVAHLLARPHEAIGADHLYPVKELPTATSTSDLTFDRDGAATVCREEKQLKELIDEAIATGAFARAEELGAEFLRVRESHNKDKTKRGKARRLNMTSHEKAAESVRKAISVVKGELRKRNLPKLAAHLDRIVKETTSFAYRPEKPEPAWRISL